MDPIAQNVTEIELSRGGRVFIAPTGVKNRVSVEGSVLGGTSAFPRAKQEVPYLLAELLDAGTKSRTKDEIRDALSARGADVSFCAGVDRMIFSGSCFPEDLPFLLSVIAECLSEASIPAKEIENARKRLLGGLEEEKTDTRIQAATALSQMLFPVGHVNRADSTSTRIGNLKKVTRADLVAFGKTFGQRGAHRCHCRRR